MAHAARDLCGRLKLHSASFSFNLQPDCTLTTDRNLVGIANPGGSASLMVTIAGLDGFVGTVNLACSGLPAEATCYFTPTTLNGSGSTTMTVTTTPKTSRLDPRYFQLWTSGSASIAGIFLLGIPAT